MGDWFQNLMNLDLNLGPVAPTTPVVGPGTEPSLGESVDEDPWGPPLDMSIREALRQRTRQRWRWRHLQRTLEDRSLRLAVETHGRVSDADAGIGGGEGEGEDGGGTSQVGEGSVAPDERGCSVLETCENNISMLESGSVVEKDDVEKTTTESGSFFDCNICLDLSREPVVTCCGHLFCWSCIYRWLHIHSDAKECPVCKGEVTLKTVTPIYGRGNHTHDPEDDAGVKIPARPSARRVESLRQTIQRTASLFPMEEMIRRLGARFELSPDFFQLPGAEGELEPNSRASLLNRIMNTRARQREQASMGPVEDTVLNRTMNYQREQSSAVPPPEDVVDLTQDRPETVPRRLPPLTYRRGQSHRSGSGVTPSDRFLEVYLRRSPPLRSQEIQPSSVEDRDSFSSIAASIHGESQTMDTAVEIDSLVSLSTSSSRRRHDPSRSSDMDSGDSRALRRRRLN
ncbi:hypothetical protein RND81_12G043000 [Saponaria officinalis]|uniref:E3 ubiquitin-protein ligase RMA n=1 Tax=Saponaria officinalis TaxID=3572 RepID=A0AAW1H5S9_SAPOF